MIRILSYGSGNIKAITRIFKTLNIACEIAANKSELAGATKLILPGVGAFDQAINLLEKSGMLDELNRLVLDDKIPVLGVCVGMQIMGKSSEEGARKGLGWVDGIVKQIDTSNLTCKPLLPHMGWNGIVPQLDHPILQDIDFVRGFYFLHSFHFQCNKPNNVLACSNYGHSFASAIYSDNIFGFQFHPEKSHRNGIQLFQNYSQL